MKIILLFLLSSALILGCGSRKNPSVEVSSARPLNSQFVGSLINALQQSPTFSNLNNESGWVVVDVGNLSSEFFHRWATLKVEMGTGKILRLEADASLNDQWVTEYEPVGQDAKRPFQHPRNQR